MKASSQAMIAAALLVAGVGAFVVAGLGAEEDVVEVEDLLGPAPPTGERLLVAVPQPPTLPMQGADGIRMVPNPQAPEAVAHAVAWSDAGAARHSVLTLRAAQDGSHVRFTLRNETRAPGQAELLSNSTAEFTLEGLAVAVRAFEDGDGDSPLVWVVVPPSLLKDPLRDVPSQFRGSLVDGLPAGAIVFEATSYKAGCSSKFLPEQEKDLQAGREADAPS